MFSTILENNNTYIVITSRHRVVKTTFCIERFLWCLKIYIVCMFEKKLQRIPRQNVGVSFLKILAHFILLKYRLILCLLRSFKWKQKKIWNKTRYATQMQPFIIQCSILPFLPMSHKPKHTQEKKNYFCPFTILHIMWSQNIDFRLYSKDEKNTNRTSHRNAVVLMPFPAVFVLLENVINGFILYKSEDP